MSNLIRAWGRENKQCYGLKASVTVILDRIGLPWSISLSVVLWQFARFYFGTMSNTRTYGITLKYCVHLRKKVEFLGVGEYCFVVVTNKKSKKKSHGLSSLMSRPPLCVAIPSSNVQIKCQVKALLTPHILPMVKLFSQNFFLQSKHKPHQALEK